MIFYNFFGLEFGLKIEVWSISAMLCLFADMNLKMIEQHVGLCKQSFYYSGVDPSLHSNQTATKLSINGVSSYFLLAFGEEMDVQSIQLVIQALFEVQPKAIHSK
jgi:hypothetical protein